MNASSCVALCFLTSLISDVAQAEDWPGFRGPGRQGQSTETGLPVEWSAERNVAWKRDIPGEGWSSPIVWGDWVFLTATTENGASCRIVSLARKDGRQLWDVEVFRQTPKNKQEKNSHATPTPITDGKRVYAVFSGGGFAAVNFDGAIAWTNQEFKHYSQHGLGASPLLYGDLLIMPFDGSSPGPDTKVGWQTPWDQAVILALDKSTGKIQWRGQRGQSRIAHVSPILVSAGDHDELVSCAGDAIQGFNPKTGERLWQVYSEGEGVVPSPAFADGLIFTASGFGKPTIRTVRPGGSGDVTADHVVWEQRKGVPTQASLIYSKPYIFGVSDGGVLTCYRADSGEVAWQQRIGGNFCASPVMADGRIYLTSEQGDTTVFAPGDTYKELAKNPLGEKCQASMAVSQGHLFIRTEKKLWCIGES